MLSVCRGIQQFEETPQYTEVNPGQDAKLICRVLGKRGQCIWQKDQKVGEISKVLCVSVPISFFTIPAARETGLCRSPNNFPGAARSYREPRRAGLFAGSWPIEMETPGTR